MTDKQLQRFQHLQELLQKLPDAMLADSFSSSLFAERDSVVLAHLYLEAWLRAVHTLQGDGQGVKMVRDIVAKLGKSMADLLAIKLTNPLPPTKTKKDDMSEEDLQWAKSQVTREDMLMGMQEYFAIGGVDAEEALKKMRERHAASLCPRSSLWPMYLRLWELLA